MRSAEKKFFVLERLKKYCSHSARDIEEAVFLIFRFVSSQLQGLSNLRLRRSLAKKQKSSLRNGTVFFKPLQTVRGPPAAP
jgi:hypothetical protein